jgi:hypothetical protein
MQQKKEMITFMGLIALCIAFVIVVGFSKDNRTKCPAAGNGVEKCCQNPPQNNLTSPWDFITQGIFHTAA